jgi:hypothetical protein
MAAVRWLLWTSPSKEGIALAAKITNRAIMTSNSTNVRPSEEVVAFILEAPCGHLSLMAAEKN